MSSRIPLNINRNNLADIAPNSRVLRALEDLILQVNTAIPNQLDANAYSASFAESQAGQALDAIKRIADALELLALEPRSINQVLDNNTVPMVADANQVFDILPPVQQPVNQVIDILPPVQQPVNNQAVEVVPPIIQSVQNEYFDVPNQRDNSVITDYIDLAVTTPAPKVGRMWFGPTGTVEISMGNGNITQQVGEEFFRYGKATSAISDTNLQVVYKTGVVGTSGVITFAPAIPGITDHDQILGIATEPIALNGFGRVTISGVVRGTNTTGSVYGEVWADNDDIYYNPVTGGLTKFKPVAPNMKLYVGTIINASSGGSGSFSVQVGSSSTLGGSDSNVEFTALANGQTLIYDNVAGYWKNSTLTAGTNVSIVNGPGTITISSTNPGGSVTSVGLSAPIGLTVSNSPITTSGTIVLSYTAGYSIPTTASQTNWDTAYTDRNKWDGGSTGLVPATGRTSLGLVIGTDVQAFSTSITNIAALAGTSGLLRKTGASTWTLDTTAFGTGSVTSVGVSAPVGLTVTGSPITTSGTIAISYTAGYSIPTTASQTNWDTAYTDRNKWDGGATGLVAATGRTSLGLVIGTDVQAFSTSLTNVAALAGTSGLLRKTGAATWTLDTTAFGTGSVTSVGVSVPTGLTVTGSPVTTSGTIAISYTAGYSIPTTASQTNWDTAYTDRNKWDGGSTGLDAALGRTSLGITALRTQVNTPAATGFSVTIVSVIATYVYNIWLLLKPTAGFATGTIVLPAVASCVDMQEITCSCTQQVTALTINGNGATVKGAPSALGADSTFKLRYNLASTTWHRTE